MLIVEVITAPSSVLGSGTGAGADRTGGGGIFFLPGLSFLFTSGAVRGKDRMLPLKRSREVGYII